MVARDTPIYKTEKEFFGRDKSETALLGHDQNGVYYEMRKSNAEKQDIGGTIAIYTMIDTITLVASWPIITKRQWTRPNIRQPLAQVGCRPAEIDGVPMDDGADHQVEAGSPECLTVKGQITDFAALVEEDGALELVRGFALVESGLTGDPWEFLQ